MVLTSLRRFLSSESPRYHLKLKNFYEHDSGSGASVGMRSLRRHLRVRESCLCRSRSTLVAADRHPVKWWRFRICALTVALY